LRTPEGTLQLKLAPSVVVTRNGRPAAIGDLKEGDDAVVKLAAGAITELHAMEVNRYTGQIRGVLEAIDGESVTIAQADGTKMTLPLQAGASFVLNRLPAAWYDLKPGYSVEAVASEGYVFHVTAVYDKEDVFEENVTGMVTAVYPPRQFLLSRSAGGAPEVFMLTADAIVTREGKDIKLADVQPGDEVTLVMKDRQVWMLIVTKPAPPLTGNVLENVLFLNYYAVGKTIMEITVIRTIDGRPAYYTFPVKPDAAVVGGEIRELERERSKLTLFLNEGQVTAIIFEQ